MNCPNCQTPNRAGANFCKHCGTLLVQACPRCGFALPEATNFCDNCGLRLVDSGGFIWRPAAQTATAQTPGVKPAVAPRPASPPPATAVSSPASQPAAAPPPPPQPPPPSASPSSHAGESQLQQYIPKELLTKLESARTRGEMVGERRVVTMLFCDVKGSTAAADRLDPEEWSEIINGAFEQMIKPVYRYEGTVARLMGDGILAFFGAPISHEDDPQRAVLAGMDIVAGIKPYREQIKQSHGIDFDVRVGINTGLVVVGAVGSDLRMEYTALGDAINLAARMEQTAKPGTVQVAHDTYKLVKPLFNFEELGGIEVKGKSEPVPAYRVLGHQALVGRARGIEGLHAEMVGRESELLALRSVIADLKQGLGRIVCVLGEAGLGKTRLVTETTQVFKDLIGLNGDWYETISLSYETNQAYGLFQRLMRRVNGIAYNDPPLVIREKLASLVTGLAEERRPGATQVFEALFGLESENGGPPLEGETFKQEMFAAMHAWWRAQFSSRPTVLVFDDMHWSDATSIELLRQLLPLTEEIPLVLICALRAERQAPAWQIKTTADEEFHHRYTEVSLRPLSEAESNELLNRLLAIAELPDRLRASILEKSGGNPFFIEEVVRSLIESGAVVSEERTVDGVTRRYWRATIEGADFDIPDNLQSLLAARLDRLEEATRATLQMASVIGRSFFHRVLLAVDEASQELDKHLGTLIRLDMIREAARVPEVEYTFLNPLTQEAVYNTILLKRRRGFHRRVGEAIEALYPDRLEGFYGLLAHHFALGGQADKAIEYYRLASRQAVAVYAYDEAVQNLRAALELIDPGEQSTLHMILFEELADVYRLLRDFTQAISLYRQALDLWRNLADGEEIVAVRLQRKIVQMATEAKWNMDLEHYRQASQIALESRASLEQSLGALQGEPAHPEIVRALTTLSFDAWRTQIPPDWERAQRFAQQAVEMAERLDDPVVLSRALGALANILDGRSLLREHLQVAQRRLEISQEARLDDPSEAIDALSGVGMALMYVGEYAQAMPHLQEAETLAASMQAIGQQATALGLQGQCWFRLDRWEEMFATEQKWRDLEQRYPRQRVGPT
ncbi:MAG TPA: adenylate/guanylate cyclase domain-containing protein [Anaerolineales bacterium]|nr:adenylate/guanylate cyclase domain-containing protein [Anaerolineales bacterium]